MNQSSLSDRDEDRDRASQHELCEHLQSQFIANSVCQHTQLDGVDASASHDSADDRISGDMLLPRIGTAERIDWIRARLSLYLVMGSVNCHQSPEQVLKQAIAGGITMFQYREKGKQALRGQQYVELARRLQDICRTHHVPFIVNDDLELALTLDADGVHVGQDDAPAEWIRQRLGPNKIVGVSAHSLVEASRAIAAGADYLGVGPVYPTVSKEDAQPVRGTEVIQQLRRSGLTIPVVGIGGINEHNAAPVIRAGADGVAVISAIAAADAPAEAAHMLKKTIVQYL
ncbi:thiamine phosphate synthase [Paenibacillus wenxiniae]|uniref:Thiamine-phosphate synthase n=1 Tax=Paenibacillus wenxiniae TaxID=1636843 RepID=A0ABW4RKC6_9BACL